MDIANIISSFFESSIRVYQQMLGDLREPAVIAQEDLERGAVYRVTHKRRGSFVGRFMGIELDSGLDNIGDVYFATFDVLERSPHSHLGPADSEEGYHAFPLQLLTRAEKVKEGE